MARVIPRNSPADLLGFVTSHINTWENDPSAVGLSQQAIDDLRAARDELRAADLAAEEARNVSRMRTSKKKAAFQSLYRQAASAVGLIKSFASVQNDELAVYNAAQISPPDKPSPRPAPPAPQQVRARLTPYGEVELRWKCVGERAYNPSGSDDVFFAVRRTTFDLAGRTLSQRDIGSTGGRSFVDDGVRMGTARVIYHVVARRGEKQSPLSNSASIQFGVQTATTLNRAA